MEPTELLQRLLTALDAESVEESKPAWNALRKVAGDMVKPWAPLLTFKNSWCPPGNALLQRGLAEGGPLRALVEATVKQFPRELWELVQEVPLKGLWFIRDRSSGAEPRMIAQQYKKAFSIYDPRDLSLVEPLKPSGLTEVVFAAGGGLHALQGGKLVTRGPGEKKWRQVHEFNEALFIALGSRLAAVVESVVTGEGDEAVEHKELHIFSFETGKGMRHRLAGGDFSHAHVVGLSAIVGTPEGKLFISENGAAPIERTLPPGHSLHEVAEIDGTGWLCASRSGASSSGPWLRFDDLSVAPWAGDFDAVQIQGDAVWSGSGERVQGGKRERPIWFDMKCRGVMALSDREVVGIRCDTKDKDFFVRFRRFC